MLLSKWILCTKNTFPTLNYECLWKYVDLSSITIKFQLWWPEPIYQIFVRNGRYMPSLLSWSMTILWLPICGVTTLCFINPHPHLQNLLVCSWWDPSRPKKLNNVVKKRYPCKLETWVPVGWLVCGSKIYPKCTEGLLQ